METIFENMLTKGKEEVNFMSPLVWAYVGDAVYELYIRTHLVDTTKQNPQAHILEKIMPDLTEEEKDIVRRARNTRKSPFTKKRRCHRIYVFHRL